MIGGNSSDTYHKRCKIYRIVLIFVIFFCLQSFIFILNPDRIYCSRETAIFDTDIDINAESAVVFNYDTGDILWEKNSDSKIYPASLTKMLSAIIAIENIDNLDEVIKIPKNAAGRNHSAFRFKAGDRINLIDLLKAALICSHNNATIALAEHVSGNTEDFVRLMNLKANEIGADNSFFENTNGLDDIFPDHKSTALDMAKIASYCMKNEQFRELAGTGEDVIKINDREIEITNTNTLLEYNYIKGIKTGYTSNAGFCIALYSEKEDLKIITVILNNETQEDRNSDVFKLLDWAYSNLKYTKILDSERPAATLSAGSNGTTVDMELYPEKDYIKLININNDVLEFENVLNENIGLPVKKNEILGAVTVILNGAKVEEINLISHEDIEGDYMHQELTTTGYRQTVIIIILSIVFYFLIFITIIVRNLLSRRIL